MGRPQRLAGEVFELEVVPLKGARRAWAILGQWVYTAAFISIADWPTGKVRLKNKETGEVVWAPTGRGSTASYAVHVQRDLESLSVEDFCSEWGVAS